MRHSYQFYLLILIYLIVSHFAIQLPICGQWNPTPNDTLVSYRIFADNRVNFRIYAPQANTVKLVGTDIPSVGMGAEMKKMDIGIWQVTVGPLIPGAYRYIFDVDGISVIDPRNASSSQSNMNIWSLIYVSGSDFMDTKDIPHGAISEVSYFSSTLQRFRRMHVYTPPGYESGKGKFPVFYLLHGVLDCDDSWTSVGRADFILDNLIAQKKAFPMVVVMPAGHTGPFRFGMPQQQADEFIGDFVNDIMTYVEKHYRVHKDRGHRAIAGLSMGGAQSLNIAISNLEKFSHIGIFSSGIFGITGKGGFGFGSGPQWEEKHKAALDDSEIKKGLRLIWFATGEDDFLLETSRATVDMLKKHGFDVIYKETPGGHTWINW